MNKKLDKEDNFTFKIKSLIDSASMIERGDTVIVSLSGGLDSVCLLACMNSLNKIVGFDLKAFHINYGLRGSESKRDENFVIKLCKKARIELIITREQMAKSLKKGENNQLWARRIRLEHYRKLKKSFSKVKIALAHHLDDQIETFFLRLIRGSGPKGLSGMKFLSSGFIIRPFLEVSRKELKAYAKRMKLTHVEDSTNIKKDYFRNWIRSEIVGKLDEQKVYKDSKSRINAVMEMLGSEDRFLSSLAEKHFKKVLKSNSKSRISIDLKDFRKFPEILRKRVIRKCIYKLLGTLKGYSLSHIAQIDVFAANKSGSKKINLPGKLCVTRSYDTLSFAGSDISRADDFSYKVEPPCRIYIDELNRAMKLRLLNKVNEKKTSKQYVDFEKLSKKLKIRNFRNGDRILLNKSQGLRKIKNIFINKKIPWEERKNIPFLMDGKSVAAVIGVAVDLRYRVSNVTRKILEISLC